MKTHNDKIGIVILAAGASTRFGSPKQLIKLKNQTLLERITKKALATEIETVVVLGANSDEIRKSVHDLPVEVVTNESWESGMSSSMVLGLKKLLEIKPNLSAVIVLLCDQPFVDKKTIRNLIETQTSTNKSIVASEYENTVGVPALFTKNIFNELLHLNEKNGAKRLIKKYEETDLAKVFVPEAGFDVDTPEDLKRAKEIL